MLTCRCLSPAGEDYRPVRCLDGREKDMEDVGGVMSEERVRDLSV